MGARTALSEEQYLHTSFPDLDREFRDGELVERTLPDSPHSCTQSLISAFFVMRRKTTPLWVGSELRMKVRPGLYLIPDVTVYRAKPPLLPDTPPFIAIEILSPDDRMPEVKDKLEIYRTWGVPHVWLVDPHAKRMYTWTGELNVAPSLRIPELDTEVTPADIFE
jgi:Uma2 family endonuclease